MKTAFLLKNTWGEVFDQLSDKQAGILIKALFKYNVDGERTEGLSDSEVKAYFNMMVLDCKAMNENYDRRCETSRENGKKGAEFGKLGGRPKTKPLITPNETPKEPLIRGKPLKTPDNECDNDNENECDNENENECECVLTRAHEDFSFLSKDLRDALDRYFAIRAQSGFPILAIQQGEMVKALLCATGNDSARALRWVQNASRRNLRDFYEPFEDFPKQNRTGNNTNQPKTYERDDEIRRKNQLELERIRAAASDIH